ncbi:MAG: hypothetical protein MPW15_20260 [Candidatus Manganitrophus sp.]|nr:hypothetical protein [Candidatus Manganitrophus sp.]
MSGLNAVHHPRYYETLKKWVPEDETIYLDPDTPFSPMSLAAAEKAVSGVLTAVDRVMSGSIQNAFCAIRPPGHHAEADRAMGFCLFNNIAIAARYLQKKHHLERIFHSGLGCPSRKRNAEYLLFRSDRLLLQHAPISVLSGHRLGAGTGRGGRGGIYAQLSSSVRGGRFRHPSENRNGDGAGAGGVPSPILS